MEGGVTLSGRMNLLKRRSPPRRHDDHLTYFTVAEADEFRRLVERSFAGAGRDVSVHADRIEDRDGTTLGLWNMGMLCAGAEPREWPGLIADHVRLVSAPPRELAELTQAELDAALRLRLVETASVADPDELGYARAVAPGLLEALTVDLGDSVVTPSKDELARSGALADLVERGRENLRALLETPAHRVEIDGAGSKGRFVSVTGESFFTASLALVLPDALLRLTGDEHGGLGTLVAVPGRHRLLLRAVDTAGAVLALRRMFEVARREHRDAPGALSPNVFWARNHRWIPVTSCERGKPRVVDGELRDAVKGL
jgi:hypothetical protein